MKRIIILLVWCGLLIILGVSCESANTNTPIPSVTPEFSPNWWTPWLAQPVCKPPCWENITPGVTTLNEAVSILEKLPEIKITFKSKDGIDWKFNKDEGGTLTANQDGIIDTIWIGSVSDRKLLLKRIVASYNEPKYVKPHDCREGMCVTVLVYPDFGMLLDVFVKNKGTISNPQIEIVPDTIIDRVYFIERGIENFQKIPDFQDYDLLMEWKGYGKYP